MKDWLLAATLFAALFSAPSSRGEAPEKEYAATEVSLEQEAPAEKNDFSALFSNSLEEAPPRRKWRLDFTETLSADWHFVLKDPQIRRREDATHVFDFRNRFNTRFQIGDFRFGLRLDAAYFPSPPSQQYQNDIRPEEIFATWQHEALTVTLGDDYLTLGRGMALSLRKFDEVGFATSLRGAHFKWRTPDYNLLIVAGTSNTVNVDAIEEKLIPDPNDLIAAGRFEAKLSKSWRLGSHLVHIERRHSPARAAIAQLYGDHDESPINGKRFLRDSILGANFEGKRLFGMLDLYGELDALYATEEREGRQGLEKNDHIGWAAYASASMDIEDFSFILEGKSYKHWDIASSLHPDTAYQQGITQSLPYVTPPTLERFDQRVVNNSDVTGLRLRLDQVIGKNDKARQLIFINAAYFWDAPGKGEETLHSYLGYERTGKEGQRLSLQAGFRREHAKSLSLTRLAMFHVDLDWASPLGFGLDSVLHWNHEVRLRNIGSESLFDRYNEGSLYWSLNLPPHWALTAQIEYLTEASSDDHLFPGVFLQYKPTSDSVIQLFAGRSKGGLKCAGGVCRVFPHFEGMKLESTLRF